MSIFMLSIWLSTGEQRDLQGVHLVALTEALSFELSMHGIVRIMHCS